MYFLPPPQSLGNISTFFYWQGLYILLQGPRANRLYCTRVAHITRNKKTLQCWRGSLLAAQGCSSQLSQDHQTNHVAERLQLHHHSLHFKCSPVNWIPYQRVGNVGNSIPSKLFWWFPQYEARHIPEEMEESKKWAQQIWWPLSRLTDDA